MYRILKVLFFDFGRHIYKLSRDKTYRRLQWLTIRYGNTPRYTRRIIKTDGWTLIVPDVASFLSAYREIFVEEIYRFHINGDSPLILDCGSNIGISILYFKRLYPNARIVAYEADPEIFGVLMDNITKNNVNNVELHNLAVWTDRSRVQFNVEGSDGGRIRIGRQHHRCPNRRICVNYS